MDLQYLQDYIRVCWGAEVYQEYEYYDLPLVPNIEMLKAPCRVSKTRLQVEMALARKVKDTPGYEIDNGLGPRD